MNPSRGFPCEKRVAGAISIVNRNAIEKVFIGEFLNY